MGKGKRGKGGDATRGKMCKSVEGRNKQGGCDVM